MDPIWFDVANKFRNIWREIAYVEQAISDPALSRAEDHFEHRKALTALSSSIEHVYSGLEDIFVKIVAEIDGPFTESGNWHRDLLERLENPCPGRRPAVLSAHTAGQLAELLGFRHVVRKNYPHVLYVDKVIENANLTRDCTARVAAELITFARIMEDDPALEIIGIRPPDAR
ncbi:hypothetical protein SAMN05660860_00713 [Geoalkalibacter ferrihydriticus]|uniref:HepT-like domain-containing protein n=1 Tax=Geoalkalibacter ferrihydriticus TaxID=392333 RepID=A0A1G9KBI4_9BACT|nr:hypothetical protein [Geoalkalibacter ferrihydriticus]SDL46992.1 hypothetical protein SAMN05660860_00713 [Geoalkalibacter ferrihydriticus]